MCSVQCNHRHHHHCPWSSQCSIRPVIDTEEHRRTFGVLVSFICCSFIHFKFSSSTVYVQIILIYKLKKKYQILIKNIRPDPHLLQVLKTLLTISLRKTTRDVMKVTWWFLASETSNKENVFFQCSLNIWLKMHYRERERERDGFLRFIPRGEAFHPITRKWSKAFVISANEWAKYSEYRSTLTR